MALVAAAFVSLLMAVLDLFDVPDWTPDDRVAAAAAGGAAPAGVLPGVPATAPGLPLATPPAPAAAAPRGSPVRAVNEGPAATAARPVEAI
jgi:hypothetical protein